MSIFQNGWIVSQRAQEHIEARGESRKLSMKTFLSIGAGPGIGLATAERFASAGFRVVLAARSPAKLEELADQLKAGGYEAETSAVDASNPDAVRGLISG